MDFILFTTIIFLVFYSLLFLVPAIKLCNSIKDEQPIKIKPNFKTTILIPARNEEHSILNCLQAIAKNDLTNLKTQVIVINDHSEDLTEVIVKKFIDENHELPFSLLSLSNYTHKKKGAITEGIKITEGEYIILRDADTISEENWLASIVHHLQEHKPDLLIGPVEMTNGRNIPEKFQEIENEFLQRFTAGMALSGFPVLCNGANLAFKKASFNEVKGYEGNMHHSSGDDIFLLEKFRQKKKFSIQYLNSNSGKVIIRPIKNFKELLHQKLRWAGKFSFTMNIYGSSAAIILLALNLALLVNFINLIFNHEKFLFVSLAYLTKVLIDALIITHFKISSKFFQRISELIVLEFFNFIYVPIVGFLSIFINPSWKGRKVT